MNAPTDHDVQKLIDLAVPVARDFIERSEGKTLAADILEGLLRPAVVDLAVIVARAEGTPIARADTADLLGLELPMFDALITTMGGVAR